jgi:hypothetical protein
MPIFARTVKPKLVNKEVFLLWYEALLYVISSRVISNMNTGVIVMRKWIIGSHYIQTSQISAHCQVQFVNPFNIIELNPIGLKVSNYWHLNYWKPFFPHCGVRCKLVKPFNVIQLKPFSLKGGHLF